MAVAAGKENADGSEIGKLAEEAPEEAGAELVELVLVELLMREFLKDAHSMQPNVVSSWLKPEDIERAARTSL